jgi:hypothetical protein
VTSTTPLSRSPSSVFEIMKSFPEDPLRVQHSRAAHGVARRLGGKESRLDVSARSSGWRPQGKKTALARRARALRQTFLASTPLKKPTPVRSDRESSRAREAACMSPESAAAHGASEMVTSYEVSCSIPSTASARPPRDRRPCKARSMGAAESGSRTLAPSIRAGKRHADGTAIRAAGSTRRGSQPYAGAGARGSPSCRTKLGTTRWIRRRRNSAPGRSLTSWRPSAGRRGRQRMTNSRAVSDARLQGAIVSAGAPRPPRSGRLVFRAATGAGRPERLDQPSGAPACATSVLL